MVSYEGMYLSIYLASSGDNTFVFSWGSYLCLLLGIIPSSSSGRFLRHAPLLVSSSLPSNPISQRALRHHVAVVGGTLTDFGISLG